MPNRARSRRINLSLMLPVLLILSSFQTWAQTDCEDGNGLLNLAPPQAITVPELIRKFAANESLTRDARTRYSYTQDALLQTLTGKTVDGQFHEVTNVSYDEKGKRVEQVTYAEQPTLREIRVSAEDVQDIREFMPLLLTTEDLTQYTLTYAGRQHVDDLDTYVFHVEPRKIEKGRRYFQGRVWVESQDLQIVKVCGKSLPERVQVKKSQLQDLQPTFVTYRQQVDERYWFPAYTASDDTLHFQRRSVHVHEVVKFSNYKRVATSVAGAAATAATAKPATVVKP